MICLFKKRKKKDFFYEIFDIQQTIYSLIFLYLILYFLTNLPGFTRLLITKIFAAKILNRGIYLCYLLILPYIYYVTQALHSTTEICKVFTEKMKAAQNHRSKQIWVLRIISLCSQHYLYVWSMRYLLKLKYWNILVRF